MIPVFFFEQIPILKQLPHLSSCRVFGTITQIHININFQAEFNLQIKKSSIIDIDIYNTRVTVFSKSKNILQVRYFVRGLDTENVTLTTRNEEIEISNLEEKTEYGFQVSPTPFPPPKKKRCKIGCQLAIFHPF